MRTRIKICCIQSVDEAQLAIRLGADALGLVAEMPSGPGTITDQRIAEVAASVSPGVATFLLTSRTVAEDVVAHVVACRTNTVQLVDAVPDETYSALRTVCPGVRIVQVVHVEDTRAVDEALRVSGHVDAVLLDSGRPSASVKELGGTGRTHDWSVSREIVRRIGVPVFVAGGLTPGNVGDALNTTQPFGVDLCSGVRTAGRLDEDLLHAFVAAVRHSDESRGPDEI